MKKGFKITTAAALAVSALTPVAAFAAESTLATGYYSDTFTSVQEFSKLTASEKKAFFKANLKKENFIFVVEGNVLDFKGENYEGIMNALTDEEFLSYAVTVDAYEKAAGVTIGSEGVKDAVVAGDLKVESVSAINTKEVEIKFSEAVRSADLIAAGILKADVISISTNGGAAVKNTVGGAAALTNDIGASLSTDGKTLTLTLATGTWEGTQKIVVLPEQLVDVNNVEATKQLSSYTTSFIYSDTVRPDIKEVRVVDSNTVRVITTEPITAFQGSGVLAATVKYADTTLPSITLAAPDAGFAEGTHKVNVTITNPTTITIDLSDADIVAGKDIIVTLPTLTDSATTPNVATPKTVTVQKGGADTIKPTVKSVTPVSYTDNATAASAKTVLDIELTEPVKFAAGKVNADLIAGITLRGVTVTSATILPGSTKIRVEAAGKIEGNTEVKVAAGILTDNVGNPFEAYGVVHTIAFEKVAPTLVSSKVQYNQSTGKSSLILTFNEYVVLNPNTNETTNQKSKFTWVNNLGVNQALEVPGAGLLSNTTLYNTDSTGKTKQVAIDLTSAFAGSSLNGAGAASNTLPTKTDITAEIAAGTVVDLFDNASAAVKNFEFNLDVTETGTGAIQVGTISSSNPGEVTIPFTGGALDPVEAKKISNYTVEGATIKEVKLDANSNSGATVRLILEDSSVKITGNYDVNVKPIKTYSSSTAANIATTKSVQLAENVAPVLAKLVVTTLTADVIKANITVSEAVSTTKGSKDDFALFVNGKDTGVKIDAETVTASNPLVIDFDDSTANAVIDLTTATSIQLVALEDNDIVDAVGNKFRGTITIK